MTVGLSPQLRNTAFYCTVNLCTHRIKMSVHIKVRKPKHLHTILFQDRGTLFIVLPPLFSIML